MPANPIDATPTIRGSAASPRRPADQRATILIVDDRPINREFPVSLLKYSGYRTVEANSPAELPPLDHLDLIIADVRMPGMGEVQNALGQAAAPQGT